MAIHESRALLPTITVRAFIPIVGTTMPSADFCCAVKATLRRLQSRFRDTQQISRGKFDRLPHATAGFTTSALDGYGLRGHLPARPAPYASDPVLVHRLVRLLHASFRPRLATTPLRFAITSPPSGCEGDFHPQAVEHARHTKKRRRTEVRRRDSSLSGEVNFSGVGEILESDTSPSGTDGYRTF